MSASLAVVDDLQRQQQRQQHNDEAFRQQQQQQQQENFRKAQSSLKTILFSPYQNNNSLALEREQHKLQTALEILESFPSLAQEVVWDDNMHCCCCSTTPLAYFAQQIHRIIITTTASCSTAWRLYYGSSVQTQQQQQDESSSSLSMLLPMLQKVYDLYPHAIRIPNVRGRLPLHEACCGLSWNTPNISVVDFLMERFPEAARVADESGQYPFHHALHQLFTTNTGSPSPRIQQQQHYKQTLSKLLDLYPDVLQKRDLGGYVPLDRALVDGCSSSILQMLFQRSLLLPETQQQQRAYALPCLAVDDEDILIHDEDHNDYHNYDEDSEPHSRTNRNYRNWSTTTSSSRRLNVTINLDVADAVAVLFPRLDRFAVLGSQWTVEGMHSLLQSLMSSDSCIRDLSLRLPRNYLVLEESATTASQQPQKETLSSQTTLYLLEHLLQHAQTSTSSRLRQVSFFGQATTGSRRNHQDQDHHHHHVQDFGYDNPAFESIRNGIVNSLSSNNHNNQRSVLVELNLHQFRLGTDCRTGVSPVSLLQSLLFSPQAPRRIGLSEIVVEGGNWFIGSSATTTTAQPQKAVVFEELKLQHLTGDWVHHLLEDLAVMGSSSSALKKLTVDSCQTNSDGNNKMSNINDGDDKLALLLKPITKILRTTKLESLTVRGLHATTQIDGALLPQCNQYLELTRALTHNTHLMEYCVHHTLIALERDSASEQQIQQPRGKHSASIRSNIKAALVNILEVHNTTLRDVRVTVVEMDDDRVTYSLPASAIEMQQDRQIDQFTQLNRFGRKEARTLATAKDRFVQLLANVTIRSAAGENGRRKALTTENMHNVLYNLLRETPSIWCGCVSRGMLFRDNGDGFALHRRKRPKQAKLSGGERMIAYS